MFIIAGLGNPGREYKWSRHNAGFEVIGKLAFDANIDISTRKFRAHIGRGIIGGRRVRLVMPQTYMNRSGECLGEMLRYFEIPPERLIVIYDDTALPVGSIRVREQGSSGGHNGMENIIYRLETDRFPRVRVGVGEVPKEWARSDYVLSRFTQDERDDIIKGMTLAGDAVISILKDGIMDTMNKYNRKGKVD